MTDRQLRRRPRRWSLSLSLGRSDLRSPHGGRHLILGEWRRRRLRERLAQLDAHRDLTVIRALTGQHARYAKFAVALVLHHDPSEEEEAEAQAAKPPAATGPLPQEAVVPQLSPHPDRTTRRGRRA